MSALTQQPLHAVEVTLSPEQVEARRRQAEKLLGKKFPPRQSQRTRLSPILKQEGVAT
ncbi:hypothetical protein [Nocardia cyriacigeorgica]|uniref:hypothetical protein n=1 Tax=Nocardia cyriacigeorgica TaxID=135487 RepID=UPI00130E013F|nr:hypothetical protein [Nocardia cyriacigeorgica]MBF6092378.1 hypothetical protein [Nocardia cyriacigeorgica]BDT84445.1 hypothetical protein FMUAM8_02090 [Nocardia cyriacigeorgica]